MSSMANFFDTIADVFQRHIPWYSEADKNRALQIVQDAKNEVTGAADIAEQIVSDVMPVETAPVTAETTSTATATTPAENAAQAVNANDSTPHFPGAYTPPPTV